MYGLFFYFDQVFLAVTVGNDHRNTQGFGFFNKVALGVFFDGDHLTIEFKQRERHPEANLAQSTYDGVILMSRIRFHAALKPLWLIS